MAFGKLLDYSAEEHLIKVAMDGGETKYFNLAAKIKPEWVTRYLNQNISFTIDKVMPNFVTYVTSEQQAFTKKKQFNQGFSTAGKYSPSPYSSVDSAERNRDIRAQLLAKLAINLISTYNAYAQAGGENAEYFEPSQENIVLLAGELNKSIEKIKVNLSNPKVTETRDSRIPNKGETKYDNQTESVFEGID